MASLPQTEIRLYQTATDGNHSRAAIRRMGSMGALRTRAIYDDRRAQRNRAGDRRNLADAMAGNQSHVAGRLRRFPACRGMRHFNWDSAVLLTYRECGAFPVTVGRADDAIDFDRTTIPNLVRFRDFRQNRNRGRIRPVSDCGADDSRTRGSPPVLFGCGADMWRNPYVDTVAREAARGRAADLRRHPRLRRIHLRHRRHRGVPGRTQGPRHLAAGRLQLVPYAAHLLGHTGDHRHHLRAHVPGEPERASAARPCQR